MTDNRISWKESSRSGTLKIRGIQRGYGQKDETEVVTTAKYVLKDGKRYLFYKEYMEDGGYQQVRLTAEAGEVQLRKTGMGVSALHFHQGHKEPCFYQSPVGPMELVSKTRLVRIKEEAHRLIIKLEYALYMHDQHMSDYQLELIWDEK